MDAGRLRSVYVWLFLAVFANALYAEHGADQRSRSVELRTAAVVSWVAWDDRGDFKILPGKLDNFFCDPNGAMRIDRKRYFPLGADDGFPAYLARLDEALVALKGASRPELVLSLNSHGRFGLFRPQNSDPVSYKNFFDQVFARIDSFPNRKDLVIRIIIDTCYSGSALLDLQKRVMGKPGPRYRVDFISASDICQVGYGDFSGGSELLNTLHFFANERPGSGALFDDECFLARVCGMPAGARACKNSSLVWSSYRNIPQLASFDELEKGLRSDNEIGRLRALNAARRLGPSARALAPVLINVLPDDKGIDRDAHEALSAILPRSALDPEDFGWLKNRAEGRPRREDEIRKVAMDYLVLGASDGKFSPAKVREILKEALDWSAVPDDDEMVGYVIGNLCSERLDGIDFLLAHAHSIVASKQGRRSFVDCLSRWSRPLSVGQTALILRLLNDEDYAYNRTLLWHGLIARDKERRDPTIAAAAPASFSRELIRGQPDVANEIAPLLETLPEDSAKFLRARFREGYSAREWAEDRIAALGPIARELLPDLLAAEMRPSNLNALAHLGVASPAVVESVIRAAGKYPKAAFEAAAALAPKSPELEKFLIDSARGASPDALVAMRLVPSLSPLLSFFEKEFLSPGGGRDRRQLSEVFFSKPVPGDARERQRWEKLVESLAAAGDWRAGWLLKRQPDAISEAARDRLLPGILAGVGNGGNDFDAALAGVFGAKGRRGIATKALVHLDSGASADEKRKWLDLLRFAGPEGVAALDRLQVIWSKPIDWKEERKESLFRYPLVQLLPAYRGRDAEVRAILEEALQTHLLGVRLSAANGLGAMGERATPSLPRLLTILGNPAIGREVRVSELDYAESLSEDDEKIQPAIERAIEAIVTAGPKQDTVPALAKALGESRFANVRLLSARLLSSLGKASGAALPELERGAKDPEFWVRYWSLAALKKLRGSSDPGIAERAAGVVEKMKVGDASQRLREEARQ